MPVIKYDVSDVEGRGPGAGLQPTPGVYRTKVAEANHRNSDGKNDIEIILDVVDHDEFEGARLWSYVHLGEASAWKLREFTDALGLPKKGNLDLDRKVKGKTLRIKVNEGSFEGEYRARVGRFMKDADGAEAEDIDLDEEEEEQEEAPTTRRRRPAAKAKAEPEPEPEAEADDDYDEWDADELWDEIVERKIEGNFTGRKTISKMVEHLRADDAGPAAEAEEEAAEEEADDYDTWELEELLGEIKERGLVFTGRKTNEKAIKILRENDKEDLFK